jgi:putative tryptophan/tyrosine transport system substrate-binding protein
VAIGTQSVQAVQQATNSLPIVMLASDPVGNHLVTSLARPGRNSTGVSLFSPDLSGKRIEMLANIAGDISLLAVLWQPDDPPAKIAFKQTHEAAGALRLQLLAAEARNANDLAWAFETLAKAQPRGLVILTAPLMTNQTARIAELALGLKLPSIYTDKTFPEAGGLMSYGPNFDQLTKRIAIYVDRIFKGEKPSDLPGEQPTKFELVLNLKTAKALGLTVPDKLLALADEVIE